MTKNIDNPTVSEALGKLSKHLDMLAGQIFSVEEALSSLLTEKGRSEGISFSKFQSLDFARQSLEDCALLLQLLSTDPSVKSTLENGLEINNKLKLDNTRAILASNFGTRDNSVSGDLDLF